MRKELTIIKNKIKKLKDRKALIDEELEPLFIREEELENEEIIAICRKNNITIAELLYGVKRKKTDNFQKESGNSFNQNDNKENNKDKENSNEIK